MLSSTPSKKILVQYSAKIQKDNRVDIEKVRKFYKLFRDSKPISPEISGEEEKNRANFSKAYKFMSRLYCARSLSDSPVEAMDFLAFRDFFESQVTPQTPFDISFLSRAINHVEPPESALFPSTQPGQALNFLHSLMARARLDFKYDFSWEDERQQINHILIHCQYTVRKIYKAVFAKYRELHGNEFDKVIEGRILEFLKTIKEPTETE